jgi:hypothetical protein
MNRGKHLEPSPKPRTMQRVHRTLFYWCGGLESSLLSSYGRSSRGLGVAVLPGGIFLIVKMLCFVGFVVCN